MSGWEGGQQLAVSMCPNISVIKLCQKDWKPAVSARSIADLGEFNFNHFSFFYKTITTDTLYYNKAKETDRQQGFFVQLPNTD